MTAVPDQLCGAGTLAFITDNFPNLKELAINVLFPDKSIDYWKMRFIGTTISNVSTISNIQSGYLEPQPEVVSNSDWIYLDHLHSPPPSPPHHHHNLISGSGRDPLPS